MWIDDIEKYINEVMISFKLLDEGENLLPAYQEIIFHMIFDIKKEDFRRNARYVAGGHATVSPLTLTCAIIFLRESVRIALTLYALNDMEVKKAGIQNAYLTDLCSEKIWTTFGSEFGPDLIGKKALVIRALCGLKSVGDSFRNHLAEGMRNLGYSLCLEDPDLWFKE